MADLKEINQESKNKNDPVFHGKRQKEVSLFTSESVCQELERCCFCSVMFVPDVQLLF